MYNCTTTMQNFIKRHISLALCVCLSKHCRHFYYIRIYIHKIACLYFFHATAASKFEPFKYFKIHFDFSWNDLNIRNLGWDDNSKTRLFKIDNCCNFKMKKLETQTKPRNWTSLTLFIKTHCIFFVKKTSNWITPQQYFSPYK